MAEASYSSESLTSLGLYGSSEKAHDLSPWAGGSKESPPMGGVEGSIVMRPSMGKLWHTESSPHLFWRTEVAQRHSGSRPPKPDPTGT